MGCIQSSAAAPAKNAVPDPQVGSRRRLSVLKGDAPGGLPGMGKQPAAPDGSQEQNTDKVEALLELLPQGNKRFSLAGQQARGAQQGFEDKTRTVATTNIEKGSLDTSASFGLGFACKKGLKPESPNQDDFFVMQVDNTCGIYGVFDGHGPFGHEISHFAHQLLPTVLLRSDVLKTDPKEALKKAFLKTHAQSVKAQERGVFDCSLSGTTGTVIYAKDDVLHVAHVGDSRSVMGTQRQARPIDQKHSPNGQAIDIKHKDLTHDHKPSNPGEKKRIHATGGQVKCLSGDINHRVFLKGKLYPGLAMSRSIGDLVGGEAGVIAEPDVNSYPLDSAKDEFILVASDGIWEFISSAEACDIVRAKSEEFNGDAMKVAEALAQTAWDLWVENEGNVVDDITVILVYLKGSKFYKGDIDPEKTGVYSSSGDVSAASAATEEKSDTRLLENPM